MEPKRHRRIFKSWAGNYYLTWRGHWEIPRQLLLDNCSCFILISAIAWIALTTSPNAPTFGHPCRGLFACGSIGMIKFFRSYRPGDGDITIWAKHKKRYRHTVDHRALPVRHSSRAFKCLKLLNPALVI